MLRADSHIGPALSGDTLARSGRKLNIVVFSGGRGSSVLSKELLRDPHISLTVAINGYDDGASTGEIRRFLGDALGPSDFRKNASRLARVLQTCPAPLIEILDRRLPAGAGIEDLRGLLSSLDAGSAGLDRDASRA